MPLKLTNNPFIKRLVIKQLENPPILYAHPVTHPLRRAPALEDIHHIPALPLEGEGKRPAWVSRFSAALDRFARLPLHGVYRVTAV